MQPSMASAGNTKVDASKTVDKLPPELDGGLPTKGLATSSGDGPRARVDPETQIPIENAIEFAAVCQPGLSCSQEKQYGGEASPLLDILNSRPGTLAPRLDRWRD